LSGIEDELVIIKKSLAEALHNDGAEFESIKALISALDGDEGDGTISSDLIEELVMTKVLQSAGLDSLDGVGLSIPPPGSYRAERVREGDTMGDLARRFGVDISALHVYDLPPTLTYQSETRIVVIPKESGG